MEKNNRKYGYNVENGGNANKEISTETRQKLSIANKGHIPWIKGKHQSEESRLKMSKSKKELYENGWLPPNVKKVVCLQTGQIFNSAYEASRILGVNRSHITSCCTGKRNSTGGYNFEYWKGGDA